MGINAINQHNYDKYLYGQVNNQPAKYVNNNLNIYDTKDEISTNSSNYKPEDGKDDGAIGLLGALKNIGKGAVKFFTDMFTDENGDFSLKQTIKTLGMIGLITAATFVPVVGPLVMPALCTYGMFEGGKNILTGIVNAANAQTDYEAEQAWQNVGSGATEGALSYVGYKSTGGIKNAFKKSNAEFLTLKNKYFSKPTSEVSNSASSTSVEEIASTKEPMTMTDEARAIYERTKSQIENSRPKINEEFVNDNLPISSKTKAELESMKANYEILERDSRFMGKPITELSDVELKKLHEINEFYNELLNKFNEYKAKLEENSKAKGKKKLTKEQLDELAEQLKQDKNDVAKRWLNYCKENGLIDSETLGGWNQQGAQLLKHYYIKFIEDPIRLENIDLFIALLKEENLRFDLSSMETFSQSAKNLHRFITEHATQETNEYPGLRTGKITSETGKVYQATKTDSRGIDTTYSWIGDSKIKDNIIIYEKDPIKIKESDSDLGVLVISTGDDISTVMTSSFEQYMKRLNYKENNK